VISYYCPTRLWAASSYFIDKTRLTFWGQSQRLLCCTCGSSHRTTWWLCSWTSWQSWRCRLCKACPLGSGFLLADSPALGRGPIPAGRTLSCCPPASADRLPYPGAGEEKRFSDVQFYFPLNKVLQYGHILYLWLFFTLLFNIRMYLFLLLFFYLSVNSCVFGNGK